MGGGMQGKGVTVCTDGKFMVNYFSARERF